MDKIVVLSDQPDGAYCLIELLNALFPECEIQIRSTVVEGFGTASLASGRASTDKGGKKNGKYSNYR